MKILLLMLVLAITNTNKFKLNELFPDMFKYLMFVQGLTSNKDGEIRVGVLTKLSRIKINFIDNGRRKIKIVQKLKKEILYKCRECVQTAIKRKNRYGGFHFKADCLSKNKVFPMWKTGS